VQQYSSTGSNTKQLGEGTEEARRAVDRYIPVKVVTSELKEVESNLEMHWSGVVNSSVFDTVAFGR
jgi:hypothetical protein